MLLLVGFAAVRVAAFTLIYHGLLGIGVSLDNPIGDDPADLPGLAFQVHISLSLPISPYISLYLVARRSRALQQHAQARRPIGCERSEALGRREPG